MARDLYEIATTLVTRGKGILAADETVPTLTQRFAALGIASTERSRCTYREMLFTAPGAAEFISGVIMQDETIRQKGSAGAPLAQVLANQGILPGIKVDTGAKSLAGGPAETVTEGPTVCAIASQSTAVSGHASRNGARSCASPTHCRAVSASVRTPTLSRATRRSARNRNSRRSWNRKY